MYQCLENIYNILKLEGTVEDQIQLFHYSGEETKAQRLKGPKSCSCYWHVKKKEGDKQITFHIYQCTMHNRVLMTECS